MKHLLVTLAVLATWLLAPQLAFAEMRVAGWGIAIAASGLGIWASWTWDFPTGAAIVAAFGTLLVAAGLTRAMLRVPA